MTGHTCAIPASQLGGYAFIGEGIPVGLGAAFQAAYRRRSLGDETADQVSVNFFGDGTCNVGQFYECLNMASLYKLPCIFVVENNKWAIGMQHMRATGPTLGDEEPYIYKKGPAFGMPGVLVDGMDVMKVCTRGEWVVSPGWCNTSHGCGDSCNTSRHHHV